MAAHFIFAGKKSMANADLMIPFIFRFAAGVDGRDLTMPLPSQFEAACRRGWSKDPDDPGGATMIDVTLSTFRAWRRSKNLPLPDENDLRNISYEEWRDIFVSMFWNRWRADEIKSQGVAEMLVDWLWASGPVSIKMAQKVIGTKADGIVGPITISAINASDSHELFMRLRDAREAHFRRCRASWKYLRGWLRRLNAIEFRI